MQIQRATVIVNGLFNFSAIQGMTQHYSKQDLA